MSVYAWWVAEQYRPLAAIIARDFFPADFEEQQDLTQEICIKWAEKVNSYSPRRGATFKGWLRRVGVNYAKSYYKRWKRQQLAPWPEEWKNPFQDDTDVQELLLRAEEQREVHEVLALLPPRYGEILILFYIEGWPYHELAEHFGRSVGTISTWLHRARKAFREMYLALYGAP